MNISKCTFFFIFFLSFFTVSLSSESTIDQGDIQLLYQAIPELSLKMTLSNFSVEERNNNLLLCDQAYDVILEFAKQGKDPSPTLLSSFLELSYKLVNCFQQNDRSGHGEIVSRMALQVLKRKYPSLEVLESTEACELLVNDHPKLPSLYAATLHYHAKSYFYLPDHSGPDDPNLLKITEKELQKVLKMRAIIDSRPKFYEDPLDSGKLPLSCSHSTVFLRTYGMVLNNKHDFIQARLLYEKLFENEPLEFEKYVAATQLVNIYSSLAREEWDLKERQQLYNKAYAKVLFAESYIRRKYHSGSASGCMTISTFYINKDHKYYNPKKAKDLLEDLLKCGREFSQGKTIAAKKALANLYRLISNQLLEESQKLEDEIEEEYRIIAISPFHQLHIHEQIKRVISLAEYYCECKQFLQATALLCNALSHVNNDEVPLSEALWHQLYITEKKALDAIDSSYLFPVYNHTPTAYKATIQRYQRALKLIRIKMTSASSEKPFWSLQEEVKNDIQQILTSLSKETLLLFTAPPTPFAILGLGSYANSTLSPYSDLEFMLVHPELINQQEREYFNHFSFISLLRLIAIQETPCSRFPMGASSKLDMYQLETLLGFRPDESGAIPFSNSHTQSMSGSPGALVARHSTLLWPVEIFKAATMMGSPQFEMQIRNECQKRIQEASLDLRGHLFRLNVFNTIPAIIKVNSQGKRTISFKYPFIRTITVLLNTLAAYEGIEERSPDKILLALRERKGLPQESQIAIDTFLQKLIRLRNHHYLKNKTQSEDICINEIGLEEYLQLVDEYQKLLQDLFQHFPKVSNHLTLNNPIIKFHTLCRSGFLNEAEKLMELMATTLPENSPLLSEMRGDLFLLRGKPEAAYFQYLKVIQAEPTHFTMLFKVAEAAIYNIHEKEQSKIADNVFLCLNQLDTLLSNIWENDGLYNLKLNYLKILFARKTGKWDDVKTLLASIDNHPLPFLTQGTIINALIHLEKGRLYLYEGNIIQAKTHLKQCEKLIARKYGPYHPYALPVYQEILFTISPEEFHEQMAYREKISIIKSLFQDYHWQGALDASLFD